MNLRCSASPLTRAWQRHGRSGLTLPELMIAMAVFSLAVTGLMAVHLMGLRMNQLAQSKLGASDESRAAISRMITEIRSAGVIRIGNGDGASFTEVGAGVPQVGNALQIQPVKGVTNQFIRYFWDPADNRLKRADDAGSEQLIVANFITNQMVFTSEDSNGLILTNNQNNRVIGVSLQFYQLQYPHMPIGPGSLYDFYQLRTKITRRALE